MTEIAIIRHGETDWNAVGRMQGQRDIELNHNGINQAISLAKRLSDERWDAIYSSDLLRAAVTADKLAGTSGKPEVHRDIRLRERNFGQIEGTTLEDRIVQYGERWIELELGVETDADLSARATDFLSDVIRDYPEGKIVVVTHGGWIMQLFHSLFPGQYTEKPGNTSLSYLQYTGEGWRCERYNCTEHLLTS
jgi:probable phosphoglycerate mutase